MSEIKNALVFLLLQRKGGETTAKVIETSRKIDEDINNKK